MKAGLVLKIAATLDSLVDADGPVRHVPSAGCRRNGDTANIQCDACTVIALRDELTVAEGLPPRKERR